MKTNETKPIICGTDFSGNARQAANVAAALAARRNTPRVLAHAGEMPPEGAPKEFYDAQTA